MALTRESFLVFMLIGFNTRVTRRLLVSSYVED